MRVIGGKICLVDLIATTISSANLVKLAVLYTHLYQRRASLALTHAEMDMRLVSGDSGVDVGLLSPE